MDSNHQLPEPILHRQSLNLKPPSSSVSKLPIKRKTPFLLDSTATAFDSDSKPPPSKFHRIWTEPDEIRFLQGLLDSSSSSDGLGLSLPRDLPIFYDKFSNTMSQPYTKSQFSDKLRRLRKKFRIISCRISRGLNPSLLSPHDRTLFDLSKKLWSPEFSSISPFDTNKTNLNDFACNNSNLVGVKVSFSPVLPVDLNNFGPLNLDDFNDRNVVKRSVDVGCGTTVCGVLKSVVAKSVLNVFDGCLKECQMVLARERLRFSDDFKDFERRWREQRVAEMDVFARRLRLVLENSVNRQ